MTVQYLTQGKKKGVFLSMEDWRSLQKELEILHVEISNIYARRKKILSNFKRAQKEKLKFSSTLNELKAKTPRSEAQTTQPEAKTPRSEAKTTQLETKTTRSETQTPRLVSQPPSALKQTSPLQT